MTSCSNADNKTTDSKQVGSLNITDKVETSHGTEKTTSPQGTSQSNKIIIANLNDDILEDTIVIHNFFKDSSSFNKVSVSLAGFGKQTFSAKASWTTVDTEFIKTNRNLISSNECFVKKINGQTVLLLFGRLSGAGYRVEFSIINIIDNKVQMVFDHLENEIDVAIPTTIADLDNDGKLDFVFTAYREIGGGTFNYNVKGLFESYCPFWVHTIDADCKLNEILTKKYNDDNYVFAGFKYSEQILVFTPENGGKKRACKREPDKDGNIIWLSE